MAANEPNIKKWFKEYAEVLQKLHIESPEYIWSGNETRVQTVPKEELYLGEVNEPLYSTVSADQCEMSTVLNFVKAVGCVCSPLIIHKGQYMQAKWCDGMPHLIKLAATSKGYVTKHQFCLEIAMCIDWTFHCNDLALCMPFHLKLLIVSLTVVITVCKCDFT